MDIQTRLNKVYRPLVEKNSVIGRLQELGGEASALHELNGPFLIASNPTYETSNPRVVIVGQENNGWLDECTYAEFLEGKKSTEQVLEQYLWFNPAIHYNKTFFQYFARIRDRLLGPSSGVEYWRSLWLNLTKLNHGGMSTLRSPHGDLILGLQGDIFRREIEILAPDVVIFLTGPNFDGIIKRFYDDVQNLPIGEHSTREVAMLRARGLPELTFRTYHPGYLNRIIVKKPYCLGAIYDCIAERYPQAPEGGISRPPR